MGSEMCIRDSLKAGDNVLIIGGGPVGLSVALWCKFFGARHIIVSDLVKTRVEQAIKFGATAAIDASKEDVLETFFRESGCYPSIIFDAVGVAGSMQLAIDYAPNYSRVVVVGLCMVSDSFQPAMAVVKEVDVSFCFCYDRSDFELTLDMLAQNRIDTTGLITESVNLENFPQAFEALKKPSDQIKVMLEPFKSDDI